MRDPLGLNEKVFAVIYPRIVALAENAGQRETRGQLISEASGRTLELGAGSGLNLEHYTEAVSELIITEPSPHMLVHLREQLQAKPPRPGQTKLVQAGAEELPFEDDSFDTVVGTYVLCTIPDPERSLAEVARVLRPGGRFLYLEHVHAGHLGQRAFRVRDRAEHVGPDHRVEAFVFERQLLGAGLHQLGLTGPWGFGLQLLSQVHEHVRARLGDDQLADGLGVVLEVQATSRSQFKRPAAGLADQLATRLALARVFGQRDDPRIDDREHLFV